MNGTYKCVGILLPSSQLEKRCYSRFFNDLPLLVWIDSGTSVELLRSRVVLEIYPLPNDQCM